MDMRNALPPEEPLIVFYIGQHETERRDLVSRDLQFRAQDLGYDFITTRVTNSAFQSRVLTLVRRHYNAMTDTGGFNELTMPVPPPLTPEDTTLAPEDSNTSLVAIISPWINLGSSDPIIAHVSRQVFNLEVAYAAFCGANNIIFYGPLPDANIVQFGRAIHEGLGLGPYLQLSMLLPMTGELEQTDGEGTHLGELARDYLDDNSTEAEAEHQDLYGSWETWNTIRTLCSYSHRLSVGKDAAPYFSILFFMLSRLIPIVTKIRMGVIHSSRYILHSISEGTRALLIYNIEQH